MSPNRLPDHFEVLSEIGAGGMGRVLLARDTRTDRRVAIKFLLEDRADPESIERLRREARAAARLHHPGIVTLYSVEDTDGDLALVQEYVEGESLAARVGRGPLGASEVLRLGRELASALAHAHGHGVLHRDLKPDNVLIASDGSYRIVDFGIARLEGAATLTRADAVIGTLAYLAPERVRGHAGDARADLFSLGAILYEALSGRRAFPGPSESETMYQVLNEDPPPLGLSGLADAIEGVARRLLDKEPARRPASADVVSGTLDGLATTTRPIASAPSALASGAAPGLAPAQRPATRRRAVALAAGLAVLVALAALVLVTRGRFRAVGVAEANEPAVAVLFFENLAEPGDPSRMGAITGNLLVTSLAQAPALNVLSTQRILDAMRGLGTRGSPDRAAALEIARRAHAQRFVTGTILQTNPLVITAEVSDVRSGKVLHALRVNGQPGETLFQLVDAMSRQLLDQMAIRTEASRLTPVAQRATSDIDAVRHYLGGLEQFSKGDLTRAGAEFQAAIDRDSSFAQARYQLALVRWWDHDYDLADQEIARARRVADRLSPLERGMLEGIADLVSDHHSRAAQKFDALAKDYPDDKLVAYGQVEGHYHSLDYAGAVTAGRRALAMDSTFTIAGIHLVDGLGLLDRTDEAESLARRLLRITPDNQTLRWSLINNVYVQGGAGHRALDEVRDAMRAGIRPYELGTGMFLLAINLDGSVPRTWMPSDTMPRVLREEAARGIAYATALHEGRFREALRISDRSWLALKPGADGDLYVRITRGPLIPFADGLKAAIDARDAGRALAIADSIFARVYRWAGESAAINFTRIETLRLLGRVDEAEASYRELERRPDQSETMRVGLAYVHATLLGARGRRDEALALLSQSRRPGASDQRAGGAAFERVRIELTASRWREALAGIDRLLGAPAIDCDDAVRLYLYRAVALEHLGSRPQALASYREFLRLWQRADPGTPEVEQARAAIRRLEGGPPAALGPVPVPARSDGAGHAVAAAAISRKADG